MAPVPRGGDATPRSHAGAGRVPWTHRRLGYPCSGCVPAEPGSVSPSQESIAIGTKGRSRLQPIKKVARSFRAHRQLILNWFEAHKEFSAGIVEGLNYKMG